MILDRTFCSGSRCNRTNTCDRFSGHLKKYFEENPHRERPISLAQFADHDGKCTRYSPIEEKEPETHDG